MMCVRLCVWLFRCDIVCAVVCYCCFCVCVVVWVCVCLFVGVIVCVLCVCQPWLGVASVVVCAVGYV